MVTYFLYAYCTLTTLSVIYAIRAIVIIVKKIGFRMSEKGQAHTDANLLPILWNLIKGYVIIGDYKIHITRR